MGGMQVMSLYSSLVFGATWLTEVREEVVEMQPRDYWVDYSEVCEEEEEESVVDWSEE